MSQEKNVGVIKWNRFKKSWANSVKPTHRLLKNKVSKMKSLWNSRETIRVQKHPILRKLHLNFMFHLKNQEPKSRLQEMMEGNDMCEMPYRTELLYWI